MLCHFPDTPGQIPKPLPVWSASHLLPLFPASLKQHDASRKLPFILHCARIKEHSTTTALVASLPQTLWCRTHSHLGVARLSWCHAGFTAGMDRERSPRPDRVLPAAHQSAGALLTALQTLPPISCWIPVSLPAPTSAKQSVKIEAGLHQNTIVNCSPERSSGRLRIAPKAGEKGCLPRGTSLKVLAGPPHGRFPACPAVVWNSPPEPLGCRSSFIFSHPSPAPLSHGVFTPCATSPQLPNTNFWMETD